MPSITPTQLNDAAQDVNTIAEIATSESARVTDRFGKSRLTMTGVILAVPHAAEDAARATLEADAAASSATAAISQAASAAVSRDQAASAATAAAVAGQTYATIAAGRAAVANGAPFAVRPNTTDGLTRVTIFVRTSASTQVFAADTIGGAEFDALISVMTGSGTVVRDVLRLIGLQAGADGIVAAPGIELGVPLYPLQTPSTVAPAQVRSDIGSRYVDLGAISRFADLSADVLNGQDYTRFKPVRDRRIVSSECYSPVVPSETAGRSINARKVVQFPQGIRNPQFSFANAFWIAEAGAFPDAARALAPFTLTASVLHQGTIYTLTVAGAASVTIQPGQTVSFDVLPIDVDAGLNLPLNMYAVPQGGKYLPLGTPYFAAAGDGASYTASEVDQTGNPSFVYPAWPATSYGPICLGPIAVTGQSYDAACAVGVIGDSIVYGFADAATTSGLFGWAHQTFAGKEFAFINLAQPGESASVSSASKGTFNRWRWLDFVDEVICGYGVNDIAGGASLGTLQVNLLRCWRRARDRGARVWQTTVTPVTASTDGFATTTNQTASGGFATGGVRVQLNEWIRAGAPITNGSPAVIGAADAIVAGHPRHPLSGYFEAADAVESARNSCLWKPNYTTDGTHPLRVGHDAISAVMSKNDFL